MGVLLGLIASLQLLCTAAALFGIWGLPVLPAMGSVCLPLLHQTRWEINTARVR